MAERVIILAAAVVLVAVLGGCTVEKPPVTHFVDSPDQLAGIRKVVLIELAPAKSNSATAAGMTEALYKALQERGLFRVRTIPLTHPACRDLPLSKGQAYSMSDLELMRRELKEDVVVFGTITHFETYPRLQIGLHLRMLDLSGGRVSWEVDYTWDSTDKKVEKRMQAFFSDRMRSDYDPAGWRLARMSPRMFYKFVAEEAAGTLPTREELANAEGS